jgi:hypothetical protein
MSIDKWLEDPSAKERKRKLDEKYGRLPQEKVQELKKKKIQNIIQDKKVECPQSKDEKDFLSLIIEFKEWLNQRHYLKGDLDKIEVWVNNLYLKLGSEGNEISNEEKKSIKIQLKEEFKEIPVNFLDEKTRIALNKKLNGTKKTSSDAYYLRKLKSLIQEKLKEAKYYETLRKIVE